MQITLKNKILIISPHPDDESLGAGGLIAKCVREKANLLIDYVSVGSSRQLVTNKTNESTRLKEINSVKQLTRATVKIDYIGDEFCRLDTLPQKDLIEKFEDTIEEFKPDIIAIPYHGSYNQDHRAVFNAAITALRPVPKNEKHYVPIVLEYFEPYLWGAIDVPNPNIYLNLDEKIGKINLLNYKIKIYKCHKTQVRKDPFPRSVKNLERMAHIYGKESGVEIAEGYRLLRGQIY